MRFGKSARWTAMLLTLCFAVVSLTAVGLAKPKGKHKWRERDHVVIQVIHVGDDDLNFARERHLTLRDVITARRIAEESGLSYKEVLRLRLGGRSYESIARGHGVGWGGVRHYVEDKHREMERAAVKAGLVMWALDEVLD